MLKLRPNMSDNEIKSSEDLTALQHKRRGQKGSITKRIFELRRLISENRSRNSIRFLYDKLIGVYTEMCIVATAVYTMTKQYEDEEWLQQETIRVDELSAEVSEYFESRKDDAPSDESITAEWVDQHGSEVYSPSEGGVDDKIEKFAGEGAGRTEVDLELGATAKEFQQEQQKIVNTVTESSIHDLNPSIFTDLLAVSVRDDNTLRSGVDDTGYFGYGAVTAPQIPSHFTQYRDNNDVSPLSTSSSNVVSNHYTPPLSENTTSTFQLRPSILQHAMNHGQNNPIGGTSTDESCASTSIR